MTTTPLPTITFETQTCMRCAGSGQYPSPAWQGVCLGCSGKGIRFTRAGRAARKRYDDIMSRMNHTYGDVKVGDRVKMSIFAHGSTRSVTKWVTVDAIKVHPKSIKHGDGPWLDTLSFTYREYDAAKYNGYQADTTSPIMIWDREIFLAAINACRKLKGATITDPILDDVEIEIAHRDGARIITAPRARGSHADCDHETTPAARRRCRATRS